MNTVQPVAFAERPIFYREQDCNMYDVFIYSITNSIVEVSLLRLYATHFTLPDPVSRHLVPLVLAPIFLPHEPQ